MKDIKTAEKNFIQMQELTDEEWMALPKEEIIQLYKNCYNMLREFITSATYASQFYNPEIKALNKEELIKACPKKVVTRFWLDGAKWAVDEIIKRNN